MNEKILVTRPSMPSYEEYTAEIKSLWESCWITNMGEKHRILENKLKEYLEVDNIELLINGHAALELSIQAMGLHGEIITSPFTFSSTIHAIVRSGCVPVFCDINLNDYTIDASKIEKLVTNKTCAILPVHVYGNVCDIESIENIARKYNLKVIYDAAHTFGEKYNGKGIGGYGDVSCFSFHATKVFNTIEGGAVCSADTSITDRISRMKDFGIRDAESVDLVGTNAKMNEFCAAMGICNLRHIDDEINKRKKIVYRYRELLSSIDGIRLNIEQNNVESNYAYFPILINELKYGLTRDELFKELANNGICARKYFYPLVNKLECYSKTFEAGDTPNALWVSNRILTLPLYAELDLKTVDYICYIIKKLKNRDLYNGLIN